MTNFTKTDTIQLPIQCWEKLAKRLEVLAQWHGCTREQIILTIMNRSLDQLWQTEPVRLRKIEQELGFRHRHTPLSSK